MLECTQCECAPNPTEVKKLCPQRQKVCAHRGKIFVPTETNILCPKSNVVLIINFEQLQCFMWSIWMCWWWHHCCTHRGKKFAPTCAHRGKSFVPTEAKGLHPEAKIFVPKIKCSINYKFWTVPMFYVKYLNVLVAASLLHPQGQNVCTHLCP